MAAWVWEGGKRIYKRWDRADVSHSLLTITCSFSPYVNAKFSCLLYWSHVSLGLNHFVHKLSKPNGVVFWQPLHQCGYRKRNSTSLLAEMQLIQQSSGYVCKTKTLTQFCAHVFQVVQIVSHGVGEVHKDIKVQRAFDWSKHLHIHLLLLSWQKAHAHQLRRHLGLLKVHVDLLPLNTRVRM